MNDKLIRLTIEAGAKKAAIIRTEDIVLSSVFRDICASNTCGKYGRCWMCPPDIGEIGALMARLKGYEQGLLYQTVYAIEDSFDIEGMGEAAASHALVSQAVNDAVKPLLPGNLHLSCGGCNLCERCAKLDDQPCRMPEKALPPMEGYGIDVYQTVRPTDLRYTNGQNTVTFFGIVLF
ncbi:MAG: DUF2284 domain-containing protein [Clostridiales bacterium]|nr:DUF2284 domain-containing protein [Clostridiales bacterium]